MHKMVHLIPALFATIHANYFLGSFLRTGPWVCNSLDNVSEAYENIAYFCT